MRLLALPVPPRLLVHQLLPVPPRLPERLWLLRFPVLLKRLECNSTIRLTAVPSTPLQDAVTSLFARSLRFKRRRLPSVWGLSGPGKMRLVPLRYRASPPHVVPLHRAKTSPKSPAAACILHAALSFMRRVAEAASDEDRFAPIPDYSAFMNSKRPVS